jgi:hypothetical protein
MSRFVELGAGPEHQALVKALIDWMRGEGFLEITCAAYEGHEECPKTEKGHIPDAKGWDQARRLVAYGEAKTADDIDNDHSKDQFRDFSGRPMENSNMVVPLYIAIPKGSEDALKKVLEELGLNNDPNVIWKTF